MNTNKIKPRAILLDFYGTLVEENSAPLDHICNRITKASSDKSSMKEISSYWKELFQEMCIESYKSSFQCERIIASESIRKTVSYFNANLDVDALINSFHDYWDEYWLRPAVYPETRNVLEKIGECGILKCLVSNVDNADLGSALNRCQMDFDYIVTSENCKAYKPRSEPFEEALSMLNLSSMEVLHVGNSFRCDVQGAKAQNISALWINRKKRPFPAEDERPDYTFSDLNGIIDILEVIQ